jgi:uncharacterized membrane protein YgaE (UPF0421/DUF939 family)
MEKKEIEIDLSIEYDESLRYFSEAISDFKATETEMNLFKMIFKMGYEAGGTDMINKLKKTHEEYEATGKI